MKCVMCGGKIVFDVRPPISEPDTKSVLMCGCTTKFINEKYPKYWTNEE